MRILLNGQPHDAPEAATVAALLEQRGVTGACAVEVNKRLIPKAKHTTHTLAEDDTVEIVTLVGGG